MEITLQKPQTLLTVPEVAERLRLSVWTIYRLVEAEKLPAIRIGSGSRAPIRIDEAELDAWLRAEPEEG